MSVAARSVVRRPSAGEALIEGYASLFGEEDLAGDIVRAGAFARTLSTGAPIAMLLQHRGGGPVGRWLRIVEDGKGLRVRGIVGGPGRAAQGALAMVAAGAIDGLSIGFVAADWSPRAIRGRELKRLELREISLVAAPMAPNARFVTLSRGTVDDTHRCPDFVAR